MKKFFSKIQYNSPVILTFAIISLFALILNFFTNGTSNLLLFSVHRGGLNFLSPFFYFRLFGHVLGHQNLAHYVSNMVMMLLIGPMLEERYGSSNLFLMILFTAFITGILHLFVSPNILLGASGIVFMLMILASFANMRENKIPLTFILIMIIYIGQEIVTGLTVSSNISNFTHIVGGLCGGIIGFYVNNALINKNLSEE